MKNTSIKIVALIALFFLGLGIQAAGRKLAKEEYAKWVQSPQNGLLQDTLQAGYTFSMQYLPLEYRVLSRLKPGTELSKQEMKAIKAEDEGLQYYLFRITPMDAQVFPGLKEQFKNNSVFEQEINYFAFSVQQDLKLIQGKDTLNCVLFNYERSFKHTPFYTFLIAFEERPTTKTMDKTILYRDSKLKTGNVLFYFTAQAFNAIPTVQLRNKKK